MLPISKYIISVLLIVLLAKINAKNYYYVSAHDDRPSFHTFGRHYEYSYESPERPGEKPNIKFKYGVLPDQVISTINDDLLTLPRWESKNSRREEVRRAPPVNIPQFPFPLPPNTASSTSSASTSYNRKGSQPSARRHPLRRVQNPVNKHSDDNNGWENERLMSAKYDESFEAPDNEYHSRQYPLSSYSDNVIRDGERASRRAQMEYENVKSITDDLFHRAQQQMAEFNAFATPKIFSDISMAPNPWFTSVPQRYNNMDKYENRPDPTKRRLRFNSNRMHSNRLRSPPRTTSNEDDRFFGGLPKFDSRFPFDRPYRMIENVTPTHTFSFPKFRPSTYWK